jgi:hypothetical protein
MKNEKNTIGNELQRVWIVQKTYYIYIWDGLLRNRVKAPQKPQLWSEGGAGWSLTGDVSVGPVGSPCLIRSWFLSFVSACTNILSTKPVLTAITVELQWRNFIYLFTT